MTRYNMKQSSRAKEIIFIDDDDTSTAEDEERGAEFLSRFVDLTECDQEDESKGEAGVISIEHPSSEPPATSTTRLSRIALRNGAIAHPFVNIQEHKLEHIRLAIGRAVEIKDGKFIRIEAIFKHTITGEVFVRGAQFCRAKELAGLLKRDLNEIVLYRKVDLDDDRPANEQSMVEVSLESIKKNRKIILTTLRFPSLSFRVHGTALDSKLPGYHEHKRVIAESDVLICRWAYTEYFNTASARVAGENLSRKKMETHGEKRQCPSGELRRIRYDEADDNGPRTANRTIPTITGKNDLTTRFEAPEAQLLKRAKHRHKREKVTYGTGCAGAGGDAEGARLAGAEVKYGWDMNESALSSFSQNHNRAQVYRREAVNFPKCDEDATADILHLSWPCQYFSPAHTRAGPDDDANSIAMFNTGEKLATSKCQIHTQENTAGLFTRHPRYFATLVQIILNAGYNIRWKVVQFRDYGLPALRLRLILMAAKVGTPLPEFPLPTHGPVGSGLARYTTIHDAISKIPRNASWHLDPHGKYNPPKPFDVPRPPYNARENYAQCLTKSGSVLHPDGKRFMTPRELACLQGFPMDYEFSGSRTDACGQIGNAVPPKVWKHFVPIQTVTDWRDGNIDEANRPVRKTERAARRAERSQEAEVSRGVSGLGDRAHRRAFTREHGTELGYSGGWPASNSRAWSVESRTLSPEPVPSIEYAQPDPQLERVRRTGTASPLKRTFLDLTLDEEPPVIDLTKDDN